MKILGSLLLGYLLGSVNPAAILSAVKDANLRNRGTKNLGASNVLLVMGKKYGVLVMLFDIAKSWFSAKLAKWLFPQLALAGLLASLGAVIGHVFPFYMHFRGGKGLAAFGGMVLAYDLPMFLFLLTVCLLLMLLVNHSYAMPMSAAVLFPILALLHSQSLWVFLLTAAASAIIIVKHWSNIEKGKSGQEKPIRDFIKENLFASSK